LRLIVHIGPPKGGSTALQHWLIDNEPQLRSVGVAISKSVGSPNNIDLAAYFGGAPGSWLRRHSVQDQAQARTLLEERGLLEKFRSEVLSLGVGVRALVVTSEQLAGVQHPIQLGQLKEVLSEVATEIVVVGYFRWQVSRLPAGWSTALKAGATANLSHFVIQALASDRLNYAQLGMDWSRAFGSDNLAFFEYRENQEFDVRRHFAEHVLDLSNIDDMKFPAKRLNTSFSRFQAEALRRINKLAPYWLDGRNTPNPRNLRLRRQILPRLAGRGGPIRLPEELRMQIVDHYAASNERFSSEFLR